VPLYNDTRAHLIDESASESMDTGGCSFRGNDGLLYIGYTAGCMYYIFNNRVMSNTTSIKYATQARVRTIFLIIG